MKKTWIAAAAVIFGVLGGVLRRLQLLYGFESTSRFLKPGDKYTALLIALVLVVIVFAFIAGIVIKKKYTAHVEYSRAFRTNSFAVCALGLISGLSVIAGTVLTIFGNYNIGVGSIARIVFFAFAAVSGLAFIFMARSAFVRKSGSELFLSVVPALFFCYWMVVQYRINADNPVIMEYCFDCFAFAAAAVSFYYIAGFIYGRVKLGATLFFNVMSVFLLTLILAESFSLPLLLILGGTDLFLVLSLSQMLASLTEKSK